MEKEEISFDLLAQRFIVKRWETPIGLELKEKIIAAVRRSEDLGKILEPYVLEHPANVEPYDYPFYPPDAMESQEFWVLTQNDLRGLHVEEKDFSGSVSFINQSLNFTRFVKCDLSNVSFEKSDLSHSRFENCTLNNAVFAYSDALHTAMVGCKLVNASFLGSTFIAADFAGSNLHGVYFEDTELKDIHVNYLTRFDKKIHRLWHKRVMHTDQLPDLYRAIRLAYKDVGLLNYSDYYFHRERVANRQYVLWPRLMKHFSFRRLTEWGIDLLGSVITGYGMQPLRTVLAGFVVSIGYAILYWFAGTPVELSGKSTSFLSALYFSFTTFATLGYGDLSYHEERIIMRLLSTSEAWFGAVFIALFVVVVARKLLR